MLKSETTTSSSDDNNMARFASLEDCDLEDILSSKDAKATKQVIANSVRTMNEYLSAKNGQLKTIEDLDSADTPDVVAVLRKFYVEVRKTDGSLYVLKSFSSIRYGLQRHFLETRKEDIVHAKSYDEANTMFKAMLVHLKKRAKGLLPTRILSAERTCRNFIHMTISH